MAILVFPSTTTTFNQALGSVSEFLRFKRFNSAYTLNSPDCIENYSKGKFYQQHKTYRITAMLTDYLQLWSVIQNE